MAKMIDVECTKTTFNIISEYISAGYFGDEEFSNISYSVRAYENLFITIRPNL